MPTLIRSASSNEFVIHCLDPVKVSFWTLVRLGSLVSFWTLSFLRLFEGACRFPFPRLSNV